jgi:hypothetical protein
MTTRNHDQNLTTYLWSAYKIYFSHYKEPFSEDKTTVLEISAFWAWFSYFTGIAILLGLLVLTYNGNHPAIAIIAFICSGFFLHPFIAAMISLAVKSFQRNNRVSL